jgi:micrococcal nuclease
MPKTKTKSLNSKTYGAVLLLVGLALGFVVGGVTKPNITLPTTQQAEVKIEEADEFPSSATVTRVIDGDTVEIEGERSVRLTGISAPELKEKYGEQVKVYLESKVLNQQITLEYEKGYEHDRFNRLNSYIFLNNENLNIDLVKQGYAKVVIYEKRRKLIYQDQLLKAQDEAKENKLNIWSK